MTGMYPSGKIQLHPVSGTRPPAVHNPHPPPILPGPPAPRHRIDVHRSEGVEPFFPSPQTTPQMNDGDVSFGKNSATPGLGDSPPRRHSGEGMIIVSPRKYPER